MINKQSGFLQIIEPASPKIKLKSGDEIFKIIGQLMIKSEKSGILEELSNKEKILEMRLKKLEQQEESFMKKLEKLREEVIHSKSD